MSEIIAYFRSSIFILGLFFMQFVILAIGNTNAALPTNTNANNVELTAMEVPGLRQIA